MTSSNPTSRARIERANPTAERTGENVRLATTGERVAAYGIDAMFVVGVLAPLTRGRSPARRLLALVVGALVGATGYHVVLEGRDGQTAGKRLIGITVVGADGTSCGYRRAGIRTAARIVDWLPAGYLLGFASMAVTERRRRIGDLAAGTVVVSAERNQS